MGRRSNTSFGRCFALAPAGRASSYGRAIFRRRRSASSACGPPAPKAYLTIKGPGHISRAEFEYEIPFADASFMLDRSVPAGRDREDALQAEGRRHIWEIDVFHGDNEGLVLAEVELEREDEAFERPDWVLEEVSRDPRYFNASLSKTPFKTWR